MNSIFLKTVQWLPLSDAAKQSGGRMKTDKGVTNLICPFSKYSYNVWLYLETDGVPYDSKVGMMRFVKKLDINLQAFIDTEFDDPKTYGGGTCPIPGSVVRFMYPFQILLDEDWQLGHFLTVASSISEREIILHEISDIDYANIQPLTLCVQS